MNIPKTMHLFNKTVLIFFLGCMCFLYETVCIVNVYYCMYTILGGYVLCDVILIAYNLRQLFNQYLFLLE